MRPTYSQVEVCLAGLLKTLGANKGAALPIKLFEVSDIVVLAPEVETGAKNVRRVAAVYTAKLSGFEIIHGLFNRIMEALGVPLVGKSSSYVKC